MIITTIFGNGSLRNLELREPNGLRVSTKYIVTINENRTRYMAFLVKAKIHTINTTVRSRSNYVYIIQFQLNSTEGNLAVTDKMKAHIVIYPTVFEVIV